MSFQDIVSDFVARVNNAIAVEKDTIVVLKSNLILNICKKLVTMGYFHSFEEQEREIVIVPNYKRVHKIKRVSKPGQRSYVSYTALPKIVGGIGYNIITSSQGIVTNVESKKNKLGGELLFQIY